MAKEILNFKAITMKTQRLREFGVSSKEGMDKNVLKADCIELTTIESQQVYGGATRQLSSLWKDLLFIGGSITEGLMVFSTQGGRNAGLSVR